MILFFVDRECIEAFRPLSDYTVPPAFRTGEGFLADTWGRLLGDGEVGLATRGFLAESVAWLTEGALRHMEPRGDVLLVNACASPFSGELVSLLERVAGMGSHAVYAGRRVVAAKLSSGSRGLFEAFTGIVEPELVYGNMWMFEEEMVDPEAAFLSPEGLLAGLREGARGVAEGAVVEEGAVVRRSYVGPGARVSAGAVVEDSVLEGDLLVEGRVRGSYLSRNTWVAGYVEGVILGLGAQVYPGAYLEGCLAGVYARAMPGAYARGARLGHGEVVTGGAPGGGALEEYRETLYRRWGRLPSRFEEELLRRRRLSRRGRRP